MSSARSETATSCCARSSSPDPDVAIVDIKMPPTHTDEGIAAAQQIRTSHPGTAVLVLSHYLDSRYALRLMDQHPGGDRLPPQRPCLGPRAPDRRSHTAARRRMRDRPDDRLAASPSPAPARPLDELTDREREVLALIAEGRSNKGDLRPPLPQPQDHRGARQARPPETRHRRIARRPPTRARGAHVPARGIRVLTPDYPVLPDRRQGFTTKPVGPSPKLWLFRNVSVSRYALQVYGPQISVSEPG